MRILAIRGRNLASLEGDFSIDFTAEPLASAGIYSISGPTGSGKSTLLDTMCLALFGRTPRTDQARENEVKLREAQGKSEDNNEGKSGSSWFGIAAAIGMVVISVTTIAIKVYRQKTRLS